MKTKIIYISGGEIFDISDIRAAFEEVRNALNLEKNTILFGVPIDRDDAGFSTNTTIESIEQVESAKISAIGVPTESIESTKEQVKPETPTEINTSETVIEKTEKKHVHSRKNSVKTLENVQNTDEDSEQKNDEEKIVPILSVLSSKEKPMDNQQEADNEILTPEDLPEIIEDVTHETEITTTETSEDTVEEPDSNEPDLEKLLSEMKPLEEDVLEEQTLTSKDIDTEEETENIDATLEKLATEFVQTQDKITSNSKSSGRSRIGKLRNILPFKQSKHHDQGLGDLFGWAGVAANDEEFSVPGFFTTTASKK